MFDFVSIKNGPFKWTVNRAFHLIFDRYFIKKESFIYSSIDQNAIKDNNARTIFTLELPQKSAVRSKNRKPVSILVKRYKISGVLDILKATFFSLAHKEMRYAYYLMEKQVDTIYPLAILEKKKFGFTTDVFFFLKKIENAIPLKDMLLAPAPLEQKYKLLKTLAGLVRRVHQAGFFHQDFHLGNVLADPRRPQKLFVIDLHRSEIVGRFEEKHQVSSLAQMAYSISTVLSATNAYRFLEYYYEPGYAEKNAGDLTRKIFRQAKALRFRHWQNRNKRCLRNSSAYQILRAEDSGNHFRIFTRRGLFGKNTQQIDKLILNQIKNHSNLATNEPGKLIKSTSNRLISVGKFPKPIDPGAIVKEFRYSLSNKIKSLWGGHPAKENWMAANGLLIRGINTAEPIALVEEINPMLGWVRRAYLLAKEVKAVQTNLYVTENFASPLNPRKLLDQKKLFIKELACAVQRLHRFGVFHGDLKANNILIENRKDDKIVICFIDLDKVEFANNISLPERILNLAQLNAAVLGIITRSDRLRFFRHYAVLEPDLPRKAEKDIIRRIMEITIARKHFWPVKYI